MWLPHLFDPVGLSLRPFSVILLPESCFDERFTPSLCTEPEVGVTLEGVLVVEARLAIDAILCRMASKQGDTRPSVRKARRREACGRFVADEKAALNEHCPTGDQLQDLAANTETAESEENGESKAAEQEE